MTVALNPRRWRHRMKTLHGIAAWQLSLFALRHSCPSYYFMALWCFRFQLSFWHSHCFPIMQSSIETPISATRHVHSSHSNAKTSVITRHGSSPPSLPDWYRSHTCDSCLWFHDHLHHKIFSLINDSKLKKTRQPTRRKQQQHSQLSLKARRRMWPKNIQYYLFQYRAS